MSEEWLGCGVATHAADCLCDVVIKNPLPPLEDCIKDGVGDLWMGRELCSIRGYGRPWTDESMLDYFQDLVKFYDAFHSQQPSSLDAQVLADMEPFSDKHYDLPLFAQWSWIRESVQYAMDRFDDSLLGIIDQLELSPQQTIDGLTTGKGGDGWTMYKIELLDGEFSMENLNLASICKDLDLPLGVVRGLKKYWDTRRRRYVDSDNPARDRMHWLCRNTDLPPREIVDIVHREHGVIYARSSVSKCRQRIVYNDNKK